MGSNKAYDKGRCLTSLMLLIPHRLMTRYLLACIYYDSGGLVLSFSFRLQYIGVAMNAISLARMETASVAKSEPLKDAMKWWEVGPAPSPQNNWHTKVG